MKVLFAASLLALSVSLTPLASGMGPAPFSQGNPLGSNDGTYQASARGTNLGGVVRFAVSSGSQSLGGAPLTSDSVQRGSNNWAIFYQGRLYTGLTDAAIMGSDISCVLGAPVSNPTAITNLQTANGILITPPSAGFFPADSLIRGQNLSGFFEATLDQKSPTGNFKGSGELEVTLPSFYTYNYQDPNAPSDSSSEGVPDPNNPASTGYGHLTSSSFKIRGTRTSTSVATSTTPAVQ